MKTKCKRHNKIVYGEQPEKRTNMTTSLCDVNAAAAFFARQPRAVVRLFHNIS